MWESVKPWLPYGFQRFSKREAQEVGPDAAVMHRRGFLTGARRVGTYGAGATNISSPGLWPEMSRRSGKSLWRELTDATTSSVRGRRHARPGLALHIQTPETTEPESVG